MLDRLIKLLTKTFDEQYEKMRLITPRHTADYLLANGVIVPPCKVGNTIYTIGKFTGQIITSKVVGIHLTENDVFLHCGNGTFVSVAYQLGKTVFLTREEAEKALKECEEK